MRENERLAHAAARILGAMALLVVCGGPVMAQTPAPGLRSPVMWPHPSRAPQGPDQANRLMEPWAHFSLAATRFSLNALTPDAPLEVYVDGLVSSPLPVRLAIEPRDGARHAGPPQLVWSHDHAGRKRDLPADAPLSWSIIINGGSPRACEHLRDGWPVFEVPPGEHSVSLLVKQDVAAPRPAGRYSLSFTTRLELAR